MIATLEEVEAKIATLVTDDNQIIYLSSEKLPASVQEGDVIEIMPVADGWRIVKILSDVKETRLQKSQELRVQLKSKKRG